MLNKCTIIGNLGQDPEIRFAANGNAIANFSVATTEKWKDKNGERQEKTEWHRVTIFGKLAEVVEKYVHKSSKVYIEGKLSTRKWTDKEGVDRYTTEIVVDGFNGSLIMLDSKGAGSGQQAAPAQRQEDPAAAAAKRAVPDDDEIPF